MVIFEQEKQKALEIQNMTLITQYTIKVSNAGENISQRKCYKSLLNILKIYANLIFV